METIEELTDETGLQLWQEKTAICKHFGKENCDYITSGCPEICVQCKYTPKLQQ